MISMVLSMEYAPMRMRPRGPASRRVPVYRAEPSPTTSASGSRLRKPSKQSADSTAAVSWMTVLSGMKPGCQSPGMRRGTLELLYGAGGVSQHPGARRHIPGDHGARPDDGARADPYPLEDGGARADPDIILHADRAALYRGPP